MKRLWLGVGLLLVLLAAGITVTRVMDNIHTPISEKMAQAAEAARTDDLEKANLLIGQAKSDWDRCRNFSAAVADHEPMEQIDGLFAAAQLYGILHENEDCAAACARLAALTQAMGESHSFTWWNLL